MQIVKIFSLRIIHKTVSNKKSNKITGQKPMFRVNKIVTAYLTYLKVEVIEKPLISVTFFSSAA